MKKLLFVFKYLNILGFLYYMIKLSNYIRLEKKIIIISFNYFIN